ncbi:TetR/AcrR family transcriptional regulator [Conexibacter sp. SYSU D00693]|uniref:TetR/AcrR family transcriptional regulator n=1 Tax=Conexibacter sp. SYSU D00693 TaxID=2812560 RepID=UPI00196AF2EE|nr:TetR/AcrR family transcriptional regulator [Conexibacter sp. SYSU D00693]
MPTATPARRRILDAALKRFAADGALGATLDDVRRDAGASVGAVYHHFADKQALHAAVFEDVLATYQEAFASLLEEQDDPEAGVRAGVAFHLRWCAAHPDHTRVLLAGPPAGADVTELNRTFFRRVRGWWRPHAHHGALRDLDIALLHALWLGPALALTQNALAGRDRAPTDHDATVLADAAWAALRSPDA